ncbi:ComF family protein [Bacillus sp. 165]|uniref:ComF family protein n=1 Tax=Bacillus sp. 165 TaxID=1529117 RepID=UPI001ADB9954|nr:ComF family protein [Bacillus sp. 165]MBO9129949.1 ComF family protein [Bacillus sp. 165]
MMYCLLCNTSIQYQLGWLQFLEGLLNQPLCSECEQQFQFIVGELCAICGRPLSELAPEYICKTNCLDCVRWETDTEYAGVLDKNRSVYTYNNWMKEVMKRFKFRGDAAIASLFAERMRRCLQASFTAKSLLIPIPLSPERLYERGFNQAQLLAGQIDHPCIEVLVRTHSEKQSKKSRLERMQMKTIFQVSNHQVIMNQNIVLIDDIYTTGATIRQAAKALKEGGARSVSSLTLCRG